MRKVRGANSRAAASHLSFASCVGVLAVAWCPPDAQVVDKFGAIIKFVDAKTKLQIDQVCGRGQGAPPRACTPGSSAPVPPTRCS